jgi:CRISPR/Cas system CMR-associated protein Cmr5 small subunit
LGFSEALFIRDLNDKLLALLFKVPDEYREGLKAAVDHINTVLEGEFKDVDSREEAFKYLSLHYSWYARYAEQVRSFLMQYECY